MKVDERTHPVPCPHCGQDLRGLTSVGGIYRCPECGGLADLKSIASARRHLVAFPVRICIGAAAALLLIMLILLFGR